MSNVKVTALRNLTFRGEGFNKGDELSIPAKLARTWANVDKVKMSKEAEDKVEAQLEKSVPKKAGGK